MTTKTISKKTKTVAKKPNAKATKGHNNQTNQEERDSRAANRQGIETCRQETKPDRGRDPDPRQIKGSDELHSDGRSDGCTE